jgi:phosphopantothenoylcysteine decarboxylase/phosphopantothenate--cysteine ligase
MKPKKILVGVTGGIAAYKALDVVSSLRKQGHRVQVVMTESACRFIQPTSFAAVSGLPVLHDMWPDPSSPTLEGQYPHLYPATESDLFILLPATANSIGKLAHGQGSDLMSTCCLSLPPHCQRVFCPSMNVEMWNNSFVQENVHKLEKAGWLRMGPETGHLACGMTGAGRLREPEDLLADLDRLLKRPLPLDGQTILMLSGPTREHIDPIRFIGNPSSGLMGKALAEHACQLGAEVLFVTGPVPDDHLPEHPHCKVSRVVGALDMLEAARTQLKGIQAVIYVAAVADYRPETTSDVKLPKNDDAFELRLIPNPDVAATLNAEKDADTFAIGFALQTHDGEEQARKKLTKKGLNGIVLNYPDSMGSAEGRFSYLGSDSDHFDDWGPVSKREAARNILSKLPLAPEKNHG